MESQPQNPEFRKNPENFHPCKHAVRVTMYLSYGVTVNQWITSCNI